MRDVPSKNKSQRASKFMYSPLALPGHVMGDDLLFQCGANRSVEVSVDVVNR
jgi:hypothetical protein